MRSAIRFFRFAAGFLGAAVFGWAIASAAQKDVSDVSKDPVFPTEAIADLNGRTLKFPSEFPGEKTIVLVAFVQQQQTDIDAWVEALKLKEKNAPAWIELPTVADMGPGFRKFLDGAMQSGIKKTDDRARVFTLYTDVAGFCRKMGMPSTKTVYALVVDRKGKVLASVAGRPTAQGITRIQTAIGGE
jgi:hypothetical protein